MIKDPLDIVENPYDFFEVSPDIKVKDSQKLLGQFMKNNPKKKQLLQKAMSMAKILKDCKSRFNLDVMFYPSQGSQENVDIDMDLSSLIDELSVIPDVSLEDLETDIESGRYRSDFSEISCQRPKPSDIKNFGAVNITESESAFIRYDM